MTIETLNQICAGLDALNCDKTVRCSSDLLNFLKTFPPMPYWIRGEEMVGLKGYTFILDANMAYGYRVSFITTKSFTEDQLVGLAISNGWQPPGLTHVFSRRDKVRFKNECYIIQSIFYNEKQAVIVPEYGGLTQKVFLSQLTQMYNCSSEPKPSIFDPVTD